MIDFMNNAHLTLGDENAKRDRVLDSAFGVFLSYGYKRVTMDDLARAAEMSRPALYLIFSNKADIYRALGMKMFAQATQSVSARMKGPGTLSERMEDALVEVVVEKMQQVNASPHGAELLDLKNELAVGMLEEWREAMTGIFRDAIETEIATTGVDLSARGLSATGLATVLLDGLEGLKQRSSDPDTQRNAVRQLVRVVALATRP